MNCSSSTCARVGPTKTHVRAAAILAIIFLIHLNWNTKIYWPKKTWFQLYFNVLQKISILTLRNTAILKNKKQSSRYLSFIFIWSILFVPKLCPLYIQFWKNSVQKFIWRPGTGRRTNDVVKIFSRFFVWNNQKDKTWRRGWLLVLQFQHFFVAPQCYFRFTQNHKNLSRYSEEGAQNLHRKREIFWSNPKKICIILKARSGHFSTLFSPPLLSSYFEVVVKCKSAPVKHWKIAGFKSDSVTRNKLYFQFFDLVGETPKCH